MCHNDGAVVAENFREVGQGSDVVQVHMGDEHSLDVICQAPARLGDGVEVWKAAVVFVPHVQAAIQHDADLPYRRQDARPADVLPCPQGQQRDVHADQSSSPI